MRAYLDLMREALETGAFKSDRTGTGVRSLFGSALSMWPSERRTRPTVTPSSLQYDWSASVLNRRTSATPSIPNRAKRDRAP